MAMMRVIMIMVIVMMRMAVIVTMLVCLVPPLQGVRHGRGGAEGLRGAQAAPTRP